jgi:pimeloyl-ACP methyl ester carboxylesterase
MPVVRHGDLTFHVQVLGSGRPVVMLHGLLVGSMATWYFGAAPRLSRTHRVLLFDLRGHGRSGRPPTGYDLATMTDDLSALLTGFTDEPAVLIGHSWGALVALSLALREPERVHSLGLVEAPLPPSRLGEIADWSARSPDEMLDSLPEGLRLELARGGRGAANFLSRVRALAEDTTLLSDVAAEADISDEVLKRVRCPTLLVYGDRSSCRAVGERLARVLSDARLITLPGGHYLPTEAGGALTDTLAGWCDA